MKVKTRKMMERIDWKWNIISVAISATLCLVVLSRYDIKHNK